VLIGPDQVAAFWQQWDHVVETAGTAAIAGHIAEGSHRLVLNEVSKRMILLPRSLVNCPEPKGNVVRRHGRKQLSSEALSGFGYSFNLHIYRVHDMF
jgi:hypothetical protein